jgi:hypothetical protein
MEILPSLGRQAAYFPLSAIRDEVRSRGLALSDGALKVYLSEAIRQGLVHSAGRNWYSRLSGSTALDPSPLTKLVRTTKKSFPLLDFTCWISVQVNPWMQHLLAHPVAFMQASPDTLESVGEALERLGWDVAVDPTPKRAAKEIRPGEKMVVLRPSLGRQPKADGSQAAIEHVLVDLLVETEAAFLMDTSEAQMVVRSVLEQHLVRLGAMLRYAESRSVDILAIMPVIQRHQANTSDNR